MHVMNFAAIYDKTVRMDTAIASGALSWAARIVLCAILLFACAPERANAHGIGGHDAAPAPGSGDGATLREHGAASLPDAGLAPPCAPGPGHACACGNARALVRADSPWTFHVNGWHLAVRRPAAQPKPRLAAVPPAAAPLPSPASPRAPPFYS